MKTSGPSGLAKRAAMGRLAADDSAHCRIATKTFGIVHILVASETAEHRLPQHLAMAHALGWDRVASFYIDLRAPVLPSGIPKPGPLQMHLPDNHMRYAIIWFSLAGLLLIAFAVWLRGRMPAPT